MPLPGELPAKNIRNIKMFLEHKAQKWSTGGEGVKLDLAYVNWNRLFAIITFLSKPNQIKSKSKAELNPTNNKHGPMSQLDIFSNAQTFPRVFNVKSHHTPDKAWRK